MDKKEEGIKIKIRDQIISFYKISEGAGFDKLISVNALGIAVEKIYKLFNCGNCYECLKDIAEDRIILSVSKDDNNNFNNHSIKCRCLECSDVAFRKLE